MSNADQVQLIAREEVTFGTAPSGEYQDVRYTGESLSHQKGTTESRQIATDRQVNDLLRTNVSSGGDINFELSHGSFDDFLASTLFSAGFSSEVALVTLASVVATQGTGSLASTGIGSSAIVGSWIRITAGGNSGFIGKIISIVDADEITVAGFEQLITGTAPSTTVVMGAQIVNGTTQRSWTFEKGFGDLASNFERHRGTVFGGMSLAYPTDDVVTGSFNVQAVQGETATSTVSSSIAAQATTEVFTAANDVIALIEGTPVVGAANTQQATNFTFEVNNNLRARNVIGTLGAVSFGAGKCNVTGTLQNFYETITLMNKFVDHSRSAIAILMQDAASNFYVIELPRIRYSTGQRVAGGENTDVLADMGYTALRHETELVTIRITKF